MTGVERGCLIIADISGYTKYLTGVELDHSTDILADLINTIVDQMRGIFTLAKLEGDAIFAYAADPKDVNEGPTLVTTVEGCYFGFRQRQAAIDRATTCTCDACSRIPSLNLKFVVHHGSYAIHEVAGSRELVGSDVIIAHRLLKNEVKERMGLNAYAFFSGICAERYGLDPMALTLMPHTETYDDVGEIDGWVLDLDARWAEEQERRVVRVSADDPKAMVMEFEFPATASVVWEYFASPAKRMMWQSDTQDIIQENKRGTRGVGTHTHCIHGKNTTEEEILDWKPYRYLTVRLQSPAGPFMFTNEFEPLGDGSRTKVTDRLLPEGGMKQKMMLKAFGKKMLKGFTDGMVKLTQILKEENRSAEAKSAATTG